MLGICVRVAVHQVPAWCVVLTAFPNWPDQHLSVWKQIHALAIHNWGPSLKFWRYSLHFGFLPTSETLHKSNMNFGLSMCRGLYPKATYVQILLLAF